jgi:ADP-ribosylglycohydrolase
VARAILQDREIRHESVGRELLKCWKCVHPGVKSLWEFHEARDPRRVAQRHDGCGAAIRVAPVGIVYQPDRLDDIVEGAREAAVSTHGGSLAIAAAISTAAAISAAIDGASSREVIDFALCAAAQAERRWPGPTGATFTEALRHVYDDLRSSPEVRPAAVALKWFPSAPLTIVPLALALGTVLESAEDAILLAANVGGDSDSVASIAGAILGARCPATVNDAWFAVVEQVNGHNLMSLAEDLHALRR